MVFYKVYVGYIGVRQSEWYSIGYSAMYCRRCSTGLYPDHRKDLKSRSPNLGPYTTKGVH